jgi:hypothetical protein
MTSPFLFRRSVRPRFPCSRGACAFNLDLLANSLRTVVCKRETRRIVSMEKEARGMRLHLEDVLGNAQYGIPKGRAVSGDFHRGDEALIADGECSATSLNYGLLPQGTAGGRRTLQSPPLLGLKYRSG